MCVLIALYSKYTNLYFVGFLPTFGPSLLHIYGTTPVGFSNASDIDGPYYKGALLSALNTIVPYYNEEIRTVTVEPVTNILPVGSFDFKYLPDYNPIHSVFYILYL